MAGIPSVGRVNAHAQCPGNPNPGASSCASDLDVQAISTGAVRCDHAAATRKTLAAIGQVRKPGVPADQRSVLRDFPYAAQSDRDLTVAPTANEAFLFERIEHVVGNGDAIGPAFVLVAFEQSQPDCLVFGYVM